MIRVIVNVAVLTEGWDHPAFNYGALIWGGVLMLLFSIERILRRFAGLPTARFGEVAMSQD